MLAYILALAVGLGSFAIYMAAFFFPEVHRKSDFAWSGVGFFYALILWVCAGRITGAVLLGQMASVALLGWFAWQTLTLRRQVAPLVEQTPIPQPEKIPGTSTPTVGGFTGMFGDKKDRVPKKTTQGTQSPQSSTPERVTPSTAETSPAIPNVEVAEAWAEEQMPAPEETKMPSVGDSIPETIGVVVGEVGPNAIASQPKPTDATTASPTNAETVVNPNPPTAEVESPTAPVELSIPGEAIAPPPNPTSTDDDFDELDDELTTSPKASSPAKIPKTSEKTPARSGGFGGLFSNIKNRFGLGKRKNEPSAPPPSSEQTVAIDPSKLATDKLNAEIEDLLPTESVTGVEVVETLVVETQPLEKSPEAIAQSASPVVESKGVPFPEDVSSLAELVSVEAETATPPLPPQTEPSATSETTPVEPVPGVELTEVVDALEAVAPTPPLEMAPEAELAPPAEPIGVGDPVDRLEQKTDTASDIVPPDTNQTVSPEVSQTEAKTSEESQSPALVRPNPPDPKLVEAAKHDDEAKLKQTSSQDSAES